MPRRTTSALLAAGVLLLAFPATSPAHDIPADVTVQILVKPEGGRLRLLIRVPLEAMRDIEFPLRGPGYLVIEEAEEELRDAALIWLRDYIDLYEEGDAVGRGTLLAARASLPSDRSFTGWETALAHVQGPTLPASTTIYWRQALLDALIEYPIESDSARFSIHPRLERLALRVNTVLRFVTLDGEERAFHYVGDPGLVRLDPRWHQAALTFVVSGFHHILEGIDHLLFLLCLVIPFRRIGPLIWIVTAFTVAHSITLIASASGLAPDALWFPPLIETLIAASIVFMAFENIVGASLGRRWALAFGFGLVHGFGFSFLLRESLQFAGSHLTTSLLAFNVGVELGQLLAIAVLVPLLNLLFRYVVKERIGAILLSALVAHTGWHWMADRWGELIQYDIRWPVVGGPDPIALLAWSTLVATLAAAGWFGFRAFTRRGVGESVEEAGAD